VTSTEIERVDLTHLLNELLPTYQLQSAQKNQRMYTQVTSAPLIIEGSAALLREAVVNLLSNAIKYTPPSGEIKVHLTGTSGSAHFEVTDSGYGIPADQQEHLFKPFFRAKSQHTAQIEGTGLGLYLVKRIIDQHRGSLDFTSIEGTGSTFAFALPTA
jgi:signal transduction histidine kinase